jgi:hypothetical protein
MTNYCSTTMTNYCSMKMKKNCSMRVRCSTRTTHLKERNLTTRDCLKTNSLPGGKSGFGGNFRGDQRKVEKLHR